MAKRFTATEKWDDPWFSGLSVRNQLFWIFLLDKCSHAGIWQVNWPLVEFHIKGFVFDPLPFEGRYEEVRKDKWFIPKFIEFQYGTLNQENRMHASVISILEKEGAYKPLASPFQGAKVKDKDMVKDKVKDKEMLYSVLDFFNKTCSKHLRMSKNNEELIRQAFARGFTEEQIKHAITNFSKDDWSERYKHMDLVYAIGILKKIDKLQSWLDLKPGGKHNVIGTNNPVRLISRDPATAGYEE